MSMFYSCNTNNSGTAAQTSWPSFGGLKVSLQCMAQSSPKSSTTVHSAMAHKVVCPELTCGEGTAECLADLVLCGVSLQDLAKEIKTLVIQKVHRTYFLMCSLSISGTAKVHTPPTGLTASCLHKDTLAALVQQDFQMLCSSVKVWDMSHMTGFQSIRELRLIHVNMQLDFPSDANEELRFCYWKVFIIPHFVSFLKLYWSLKLVLYTVFLLL